MKETRTQEERIEDFKRRLETEVKNTVRNPQVRSARILMLELLTWFNEEEHHESPPIRQPEPAWSPPAESEPKKKGRVP